MSVLRVGILGWGAIGRAIAERLVAGAVPGVELSAVASRRPPTNAAVRIVEPSELPNHCDLVIETAGHAAVVEHVPGLLGSGCQVILLSTGALRDAALFGAVTKAGSERLLLSTGAIGGIDIIGACLHAGQIHSISLTTTKPSGVLVQPWMDAEMASALRDGKQRVECFEGPAVVAAEKFPSSVNVAATLALAAKSWALVRVTVIGDPTASGNTHVIDIDADAGQYSFEFANKALAANPTSSALVVASVLRALDALTCTTHRFV